MEFKIYGSYTPYEHQINTHKYITSFNYQYSGQVVVIKASRQIYGKTQFTIAELLRHCINKDNADCVFVAPTYTQCLENFKKITYSSVASIIQSSDQSNLNILFKNGSRIRMFSAAQKNNIRGITVKTLLIVDEAAFIDGTIWYEILFPTTAVHKPLIILTSTPYFKSGFFYDMYNGGKNITVFDWCRDYAEIIDRNSEYLKTVQETMPYNNFKTEYLGEWLEIDDNSLFKLEGNLIKELSTKPTASVGIDFGSGVGKDSTVVVGFDEDGTQTIFYAENELSAVETVKAIAIFLRGVKNVVAESNSIGSVYIDMLRKEGIVVNKFVTTNKSKREIIEKLITATQHSKVKLLSNNNIITQFSKLEVQPLSNNGLTYNAKNGFHDDIVMAAAIAYHGLNKNYNIKFI